MEERRGEVQAALHASGELPYPVPLAVLEPDRLQDFVDPAGEHLPRKPVKAAEDCEVLLGAELRVEGEVLGNEAQGRPGAGVRRGDLPAIDRDYPAIGDPQPCDQGHEGRLARAVGSQQAEEFPCPDLEAQGIDRLE